MFSSIAELVKDNIDVFLISETKIDSNFPSPQFAIDINQLYVITVEAYTQIFFVCK